MQTVRKAGGHEGKVDWLLVNVYHDPVPTLLQLHRGEENSFWKEEPQTIGWYPYRGACQIWRAKQTWRPDTNLPP